jgi:hypothetical protein
LFYTQTDCFTLKPSQTFNSAKNHAVANFLKIQRLQLDLLSADCCTLINAALVSIWLYLLWPLFSPVYLNPIYVAYLMILTIPVLGYASLALVGSVGRPNVGLLMVAFRLCVGEIYLRLWIPRQAEIFGTNCHERPASLATCLRGRPKQQADG